MRNSTKAILAGGITAVAIVAVSTGGAQAAVSSLIGSKDIKDNSVRSVDIRNGGVRLADINDNAERALKGANGVNGTNGTDGVDGVDGTDGVDGIPGLYYVTATYGTAGGDKAVNEGAIATVACHDAADHAVAGGVQTLGLGEGTAPAAVASSFPGRMDWEHNTPKANRFDGWIVQFDARNAPVKANIWVTCAEGTKIPQIVVPVS